MKKTFILSVLLVVMPLCLYSYSELPYLNIPIGAKSAALGGAYSAIAGDIETLWYNPAGLAGMKNSQLLISHVSWVGDVNLEYLLFGLPINDFMAAGIAANVVYNTDQLIDETGLVYGHLFSYDVIINAGLGLNFGSIDTGFAIKVVKETYDAQQVLGSYGENLGFVQGLFGVMSDWGVLAHFFDDHINAAVVVQNVFGSVKDDMTGAERRFSAIVKAGIVEKDLIKGLLLSQEYRLNIQEMTGYPSFGIQYEQNVGDIDFAIRCGYEMQKNIIGGFSGFTAGAGIGYKIYKLNYAYAPYDFAGSAHRFSMNFVFGDDELENNEPVNSKDINKK